MDIKVAYNPNSLRKLRFKNPLILHFDNLYRAIEICKKCKIKEMKIFVQVLDPILEIEMEYLRKKGITPKLILIDRMKSKIDRFHEEKTKLLIKNEN